MRVSSSCGPAASIMKFNRLRIAALTTLSVGTLLQGSALAEKSVELGPYGTKAAEVMNHIQENYWLKKRDLYATTVDKRDPDFIWGCGVMFSALAGATRHDPKYKGAMRKFFEGMEVYWDSKARIPGYEPAPTSGNGHDKYYDDNAWMVLTFLEAYEMTHDSRYLKRAGATLDFVVSGWDEQAGGGLWWHENHQDDSKNTCANAPAAVGCFRITKFSDPKSAVKRITEGEKIVKWTTTTLRASNGLFGDSINVTTGVKNNDQLTYNAALMLRAYLCLHSLTGEYAYLDEAVTVGNAAESLLGGNGAYRDPIKWSHLMVEADFELHRQTKDPRFLKRALTNCDVHYEEWKTSPPNDLLANASLARELWLAADTESAETRDFWEKSDQLRK